MENGKRIWFFGTPVDLHDLDATIAIADHAMSGGPAVRHTALNVAKLVNLRKNLALAEDVRASDLVGIDGMGIIYGLRLFGVTGASRVAGVDLFLALLKNCAATGRQPYILGARQEQLNAAMSEAKRRYPGLHFAGARNGYFDQSEEDEIVADIRGSGADCLFVAMPTPHKESFLNKHGDNLGARFVMGVGGSVDVLAGHVSRAPQWMQAIGLEWFHRLLQEPRKMFRRYAVTNSVYAWMLLRAKLSGSQPVEAAHS